MIELRQGKWEKALADVESVDALISDAPYSERTHSGSLSGNDVSDTSGVSQYKPITEQDVWQFTWSWAPRVQKWVVIFGDHVSYRWWEAAWEAAGWLTFAPVIWLRKDAPPRFRGDGPQRSGEFILCARRRGVAGGHRKGFYMVTRPEGKSLILCHKSLRGTKQLVSDYAKPGDLVCDPFAGTGTTLHACHELGIDCIGAEKDRGIYGIARDRLEALGAVRERGKVRIAA